VVNNKLFATTSDNAAAAQAGTSITDEANTAHEGLPNADNIGQGQRQNKATFDEAKNKLRDEMIAKRVKEGVSQEQAEKEVDATIEKVLREKQAEARYRHGEFDHDFLKVYMDDPFLGTISQGITKLPDFTMPTAYVGVRPNGKAHEVLMGFNPEFFRSLNNKQRRGVVKHELYHLVFQHIFERAVGDKEYQVLWNWATDLAINSIIGKDNLPDACLIPGTRPIDPSTGKPIEGPYAEFIEQAPVMQASDFYFEKLREIQQREGNNGSLNVAIGQGMGTLDDHGKWDQIPKDIREQIKSKVRDMLDQAVRKAERTNDWGSVPAEIQQIIKKLLSREVDWKSVLRNFIGRCRSMDRISTIKRINKRAPYMFPGCKRNYVATFACFIDQSGSMSDDDISMLFSELETFAQETQIDVYHFDTEIDLDSHTVWARNKPFPSAHRTRCGGTDFQSIANFANQQENRGKWSGICILTDGYAPTMGQIFGSRVMWVITEHGTMDAVRSGDLAIQMKKEKQFKRY